MVAAELERRWELALQGLAEATEARERCTQEQPAPQLEPALRAQLADVGRHLPTLWASDRLTAAHKKELLRSLIRRVILSRPTAETVEVKIVWVSGAYSVLSVEARVHRSADLQDYPRLVARVEELSAQGYQDEQIAQRLTVEGFRSARRSVIVRATVENIRRATGQVSLTERFRTQSKIGDCWTVWGLARELGVSSDWLRKRIEHGTLPATLHPLTKRYLIADDAVVLGRFRAQLAVR